MPGKFKCRAPNCTAEFARDEHLTRHERTHSQERPFHCTLQGCDKWFSRLDNVRQHVKGQHKAEVENGQADNMLREMTALRKRLSAEATSRRRARGKQEDDDEVVPPLPTSSALQPALNASTHVRDSTGRFASRVPVATTSFFPQMPGETPVSSILGTYATPTPPVPASAPGSEAAITSAAPAPVPSSSVAPLPAPMQTEPLMYAHPAARGLPQPMMGPPHHMMHPLFSVGMPYYQGLPSMGMHWPPPMMGDVPVPQHGESLIDPQLQYHHNAYMHALPRPHSATAMHRPPV